MWIICLPDLQKEITDAPLIFTVLDIIVTLKLKWRAPFHLRVYKFDQLKSE
jgi:hypothetical protein